MSAKIDLFRACVESVAEQGLDGIATSRIAKRAGVATGTLFHHFPDKRALLSFSYLSIIQRLERELSKAIETNDNNQAAHYWNSLMKFWVLSPVWARYVQQFRVSVYYTEEIRAVELSMIGDLLPLFKKNVGGSDQALHYELCMNTALQLAMYLLNKKPNEDQTGELLSFGYAYAQSNFNLA